MDADTGDGNHAPEAYALVDCPAAVEIGKSFPVEVGLGAAPQDDTDDERIDLPPWQDEPFTVTITLHLTNVRLWGSKQSRRFDLEVSRENPYPTKKVRLYVPKREDDHVGAVHVDYYLGTESIGAATRIFQIGPVQPGVTPVAASSRVSGRPLTMPTAPVAPDLTIQIRFGEREGDLAWQFLTSNPAFDFDKVQATTRLGSRPEAYAQQVMQDMEHATADDDHQYLKSIGGTIASRLPRGFITQFGNLSRVLERPPTVLLVTEESFIPWELAYFEDPVFPGCNYFGAQAVIGRWYVQQGAMEPLGEVGEELGVPASPRGSINLDRIAVVWGSYPEEPLDQAVAEARRMIDEYHAESIEARFDDVRAFFDGDPGHTLIHYAGHGEFGADAVSAGLRMVDGGLINVHHVGSSRFGGGPLVFLNACQVGTGFEQLGGLGSMIEALVRGGAVAVVAPLWSVADDVANTLAAEFYQRVVASTPDSVAESPAAVLREQRSRFTDDLSASLMAYQFYGHPNLVISRTAG